MTQTTSLPPPSVSRSEDKVLPAAIYVLHLLFFVTGLTPIIGLILAYAGKGEPESWRTSHYVFAIWTFWLALAASAFGWLLIGIGVPLLLIVVGFIPMLMGGLVLAAVAVWFAVRCAIGLTYAMRAEPYPRPRNLIV